MQDKLPYRGPTIHRLASCHVIHTLSFILVSPRAYSHTWPFLTVFFALTVLPWLWLPVKKKNLSQGQILAIWQLALTYSDDYGRYYLDEKNLIKSIVQRLIFLFRRDKRPCCFWYSFSRPSENCVETSFLASFSKHCLRCKTVG